MDIRDINWKERPAGNTLLSEIEKLAAKIKVPKDKQKDLEWLSHNLRSHAMKDKGCCCEHKALISYVGLALQEGINALNSE